MAKTLHIHGSRPINISYRYRDRASFKSLRMITENPVPGPLDRYTLVHVPIATGMLTTETTTQRVIIAMEEKYGEPTDDLESLSISFEDAEFIQQQMNMPLCILCNGDDDGENKWVVYIKTDAPPITTRPSHLRQ